MKWFRVLLRLWRGDDFHEATRLSQETRDAARPILDRAKETLDGECNWVWGERNEKTASNRD